jgi:nucleotide-binding universal stress UspA family protein
LYKHLLLATDGSEPARRAAAAAIDLARSIRARLTVLYATPVFRPSEMHAHGILREAQLEATRAHAHARNVLDPIDRAAHSAGITCTSMHVVHDKPWRAILEASAEHGCDLIVMGSQGTNLMRALVRGSQAELVIGHSTIPVLVFN